MWLSRTMPYQVWVAELTDEASTRVDADKPNVWVGITSADPSTRFDRLRAGDREHPVARFGQTIRHDLFRDVDAAETRTEAEQHKRELIRALRRCGFTVNRQPTRYHVYVVLLDPDNDRRPEPERPWVYVGQSKLAPLDRLAQHKSAARNSKGRLYNAKVRDHGLRLLPQLVEDLPPIYVEEDALDYERKVADRLRAEGYAVEGGT